MKATNIQILTELMREMSFYSGDAAADNLYDIANSALSRIDIDADLDNGTGDEVNQYEELPTSHPVFVKSLAKRTTEIAKSGGYALLLKKGSKSEFDYFLVNKSAKKIGEFFIASMRTDTTTYRRYNLKKAFDVIVETVHWSNLATELRGRGVGKLLYTLVYDYVKSKGRALGSDSILYEGSAGMWMTYMPKLAPFFGVVLDGVILPISKEELTIKNKPIFDIFGLDGFIAMENPPKLVRKIMHNVQGLSYIGGEYGVAKSYASINDTFPVATPARLSLNQIRAGKKEPKAREVLFIDYVNEFKTIKDLLKSEVENIIDEVDTAKKKKNIKALIFAFYDAIVVVKQTPNGLVPVVI